jgi:hypothetical protein
MSGFSFAGAGLAAAILVLPFLVGCNSTAAPPPAAAYGEPAPAAPAGKLGSSNETVSGLTSAECLRRFNAGEINGEACLEPGI